MGYNKDMNKGDNISNIEKQGLRLLDKINYDDVVALSIAEYGAMGDPGAIIVMNKDLSHFWFHHYNIDPEKLKQRLPMLKNLRLGCGDAINVEVGWTSYYYGYGNYLFIRDEYYHEAKKSLEIAKLSGVIITPNRWPNIISEAIQKVQSGNIGKNESDILYLDEIADNDIAAILIKEGTKPKISVAGIVTKQLSEYYFHQYDNEAEKLENRLALFQNLELCDGEVKGVDKKKWGTCYLGSDNYLFIKREYCKRFQSICDNEQISAEQLLDNWRYITKRSIHADIKLHKISSEKLKNLKEEDVLFITSPGRMGDETGSTVIVKSENNLVAYRIDWAADNPEISVQNLGLVFPQWYKYDKENSRYIRIEMGFGNLLYVKKDIIKDFIPLLQDAVHDELGYKTNLMLPAKIVSKINKNDNAPTLLCGGAAFRSWRYAAKLLLGDKLQ